MKNLTISQRLLALLGALLGALVVAGALLFVAETRDTDVTFRREEALTTVDRIRYAMLQMGYGMRGMMVEATIDAEKQRKLAADEDFNRAVVEARAFCAPAIMPANQSVRTKTLFILLCLLPDFGKITNKNAQYLQPYPNQFYPPDSLSIVPQKTGLD